MTSNKTYSHETCLPSNPSKIQEQERALDSRLSALKMGVSERARMARDAVGLKITYESLSRPTSRSTQQTDS